MALNREMTMEEKKIREYTESQISRAGQLEHIVFTDEQRDILLDYASTIGDQDSIRQMVWKLSEDMAIMPVICSRFVKKKRWICIG